MFGFKFGRKQEEETAPEGDYVIARLNARVQPIDRGEYFEDPLQETLQAGDLGEVTGGGTQLADEPAGIAFCDVEIRVNDLGEQTLTAIAQRLEALGAPKGSKLIIDADGREIAFGAHEGLAVFLDGQNLPDNVYAECDVNHVIAELDRLMGEKGAFRGYWQGSAKTGLYCYGASFDAMKDAIAPLLSSYPLCQNAIVEQIA